MVQINNYIVMKQIILVLIACLLCSNIDAQDKKLQKQIDGLKKQKTELETELNSINTKIALIENRSFSRETPSQLLKRRLSSYRDVEELSKKMPRNLDRNAPIVDSYYYIIEMYESVMAGDDKKPIWGNETHGYDKVKNDFYKNNIEAFRHQVMTVEPQQSFVQSFEKLATQIKDYRFTMFELVRIFDLVDEKTKKMDVDGIYSSLRADEETEFVDKIPFTKSLLQEYIEADEILRNKIRERKMFDTIK